ncbi:MAG: prepilin peptidase [Planctomycetota bacterium]|nr:prepilin peptidase [Planctomycetota bacterium]
MPMTILALSLDGSMLWQHLPWAIFAFCLGACVGSFVNVVVHRMPSGMSLLYPPSRCPTCGGRLRFFRENLPILGWVFLRGRCRMCGTRISPMYALVELGMGLMFLGLYVVFFWVSFRNPWWGVVAGQWWDIQTFLLAWPAWICIVFLLAALYAMTIIDARTFTIPIQIPVFITVVAFLLWPIQGLIARIPKWKNPAPWPIPGLDWTWCAVAFGGLLGVLIGCFFLWSGRLKYSFSDYEDYVQDGQVLGDYPHARREMWVELLFLVPVFLGLLVGALVGVSLTDQLPPAWVQSLGGSMLGYLVGGGMIWAVRILGTFGFGREAMGMGDVHLLGCIGAVMGWFDPILVFFIAPFIGLAWTLFSALGRRRRELPYGPHLAVAAVFVLLARPLIISGWEALLPMVPMPPRVLMTELPAPQAWDPATDRMSTTLDSGAGTGFNGPGHRHAIGELPMKMGDRPVEGIRLTTVVPYRAS